MVSENVTLVVDDFGTVEDHISKEQKQVKRFTWKNAKSNVSVQVCTFELLRAWLGNDFFHLFPAGQIISYGAMIHSVKLPSKSGEIADIALGFDSMDGIYFSYSFLHRLFPPHQPLYHQTTMSIHYTFPASALPQR
jgi:hypothetical protein